MVNQGFNIQPNYPVSIKAIRPKEHLKFKNSGTIYTHGSFMNP